MIMQRQWAFPSSITFSMVPIINLLSKYIERHHVVLDPFARDNIWATHSNDLNPATSAQHHLDAQDYMAMMAANGFRCDVVLLDPPYSSRQVMECYQAVGRKVTQYDTQFSPMLNHVKDYAATMLKPAGVVLSFGWNSIGMGINRGFEIIEILLVSHGSLHHDTICTVERKINLHIG